MSVISPILRIVLLLALAAGTFWHASNRVALREARQAEGRGNDVEAVRRAWDHLEEIPWSQEASLIAARGLSRLDFAALAEPYYQRASQLDLDDLHVRAFGLTRANQREQAIEAYLDILNRRPDDVLALRRLGGIYISQIRYQDALEVARRLEQIPEGTVIGLSLAGTCLHLMPDPDYEQAVDAFDRAFAEDPGLEQVPLPAKLYWSYLSAALLKLGRAERAVETIGRALADGEDADLLTMLGDAYHQQGLLDAARDAWTRAARVDPRASIAWLKLGQLALEQGDPSGAIPPLERAAELIPSSYEPFYNLALASRRLGLDTEADRYQEQADRLRNDAPPKTTMGMMPDRDHEQ
ncbi:tetratricopeptide repeat protein [Tautonia rosea]|uniref:tetratricopeptide repeat protein n=1 Tax=Tautonia rosea TaxID=2728037 RepID=UPI001475D8D4|nr:tetratricopeptide repeat protein [Tautonia rosea]